MAEEYFRAGMLPGCLPAHEHYRVQANLQRKALRSAIVKKPPLLIL